MPSDFCCDSNKHKYPDDIPDRQARRKTYSKLGRPNRPRRPARVDLTNLSTLSLQYNQLRNFYFLSVLPKLSSLNLESQGTPWPGPLHGCGSTMASCSVLTAFPNSPASAQAAANVSKSFGVLRLSDSGSVVSRRVQKENGGSSKGESGFSPSF
jgi:hypothetical protein